MWIKDENGIEDSYDFETEIEKWKYKKICFDGETEVEKSTAKSEEAFTGVWFLQHKEVINVTESTNEVFAVEIPKKYHNHEDIIAAKKVELVRWEQYDAYESLELKDQHIISTRWVITEKDNGKIKARLVVRGFEEMITPQSDSPTASKESGKLFLAICANENFTIKSLDVTSAFLQGRLLDREVYVMPPEEVDENGKVWKLKKTVYGLYDASRSWYFAVKEEVLKLGMKTLSGDLAFFYLVKENKLLGLCIVHVDDFLMGGNQEFFNILNNTLLTKFTFGKMECKRFKYTGLNIEQKEDGSIFVDQNEYIQSLKPIELEKAVDKKMKLPKKKFTEYRALTGQLSWAAENTRPDLAFDVRELSVRNKEACYNDVKKANKILKKAQTEQVAVKYSKLGKWKDIRVGVYTDSSYRNDENKVKSVGGRFVSLFNKDGVLSPLLWKSKTIQQVCKSVKTAETRSLERGLEDGIFMARMVEEIYTGKVSEKQIEVEAFTDSKTLLDSINSTKQVDEKTVRHLVAWIKEQIDEKKVKTVNWVCSEEMIADVFTKANAKTNLILEVVKNGRLPNAESSWKF